MWRHVCSSAGAEQRRSCPSVLPHCRSTDFNQRQPDVSHEASNAAGTKSSTSPHTRGVNKKPRVPLAAASISGTASTSSSLAVFRCGSHSTLPAVSAS
ncbi:hypothetical protein ABB37_02242 [Leptomonas pyrrhocoris]|uniref:Uncharacterized protein n=1 Tax=Leptomonas pyrrhocoris TaxID=157538 RepID=A0A0M9G7J8_LEPPY|nr:hypothetical protein ABB37_02242 [Leptomonas pyrrhocoris]KPA84177.1 hypothetical protein ABB37_02242 [Leptomonas pyrrhocoris]|eukprot:XP_015662616.1 hypothetical protein ABB37_02242 [Leptomonas pyrrhocoris]